MHRKMLALIFIFFGISFFSLAQESEWYLEKTIAKIEFSGLKDKGRCGFLINPN